MKGSLVLVWLALASLVTTKPFPDIEGDDYGSSNVQLNAKGDYYEGFTQEDYLDNYPNAYPTNDNEYYGNKKCSSFMRLITSSYKSSVATQQSMVESSLVKQMEELVLYIQDKVALAQRKQEAGQHFVFNNLWEVMAESQSQQMSSIFKGMVRKYVGFVEKTLNGLLGKEEDARFELESIISDGVDSLASYTQQRDWRNGGVSQFEEDAGCFYDFIMSELNYTLGGMAKEDFKNAAKSLAHSLRVIATSHGVKTTITNIAMDAAKKLKTVDFEEIENELFESFDIVSDTIVQWVEVIDRAFQYGVWQMALDNQAPRLDDLILKAVKVVKSDNFNNLHFRVVMEKIDPAIAAMVDFILELSNQVDVASGLETLAATVQEALVESVRIDGEEIATVVEDYLYTNIEDYLFVLENLGSVDLASLVPLLNYGMENTKPTNGNEAIRSLDDEEDIQEESIFPYDTEQDEMKEVLTDDYEEVQKGNGDTAGELDDYEEIVEDDLTIQDEDSSDGYKEIIEEDLAIKDEYSLNDFKEIVNEDVSILEIEDSNIEIQAEKDNTDIVEENNTENIEIEEDYGFVYKA